MLITLARKPLCGSVVQNVLTHGVGALNVDATRIELDPSVDDPRLGGKGEWHIQRKQSEHTVSLPAATMSSSPLGRWPANVLHDGSGAVLAGFPRAGGGFGQRGGRLQATVGNYGLKPTMQTVGFGDSGSAARFFKRIGGGNGQA